MAKKSTTSTPTPGAHNPPTAEQMANALRYLARETKREAEVAQLLGDKTSD